MLHCIHVSHLIQWCSRLLSIQSLAGTIVSFQFPPTWGWLYLSLYTLLPAASVQVNSVRSLVFPLETQFSFAWSKDISWSADILLTSLCIQKEETHFATQEIDMNLKQICWWGHHPCSLKPCCTCWWGIFLKDNTNKHVSHVSLNFGNLCFLSVPFSFNEISKICAKHNTLCPVGMGRSTGGEGVAALSFVLNRLIPFRLIAFFAKCQFIQIDG